MPNLTTIEVHRAMQPVTRALRSIPRSTDIKQYRDVMRFKLGTASAIAIWSETDQCTVVTVHDPDEKDAGTSAVFASLASLADRFEMWRNPTGEFYFRF